MFTLYQPLCAKHSTSVNSLNFFLPFQLTYRLKRYVASNGLWICQRSMKERPSLGGRILWPKQLHYQR